MSWGIYSFLYLFIHLFLYLCIYLFKHLFIYSCIYLNIYLSIYLFIPIFSHAFIYLYLSHFKCSILYNLSYFCQIRIVTPSSGESRECTFWKHKVYVFFRVLSASVSGSQRRTGGLNSDLFSVPLFFSAPSTNRSAAASWRLQGSSWIVRSWISPGQTRRRAHRRTR